MTCKTNHRYNVKVSDGDRTLNITCANRKVAWELYGKLPRYLSAELPEEERHAVYRSADEALDSVLTFFR